MNLMRFGSRSWHDMISLQTMPNKCLVGRNFGSLSANSGLSWSAIRYMVETRPFNIACRSVSTASQTKTKPKSKEKIKVNRKEERAKKEDWKRIRESFYRADHPYRNLYPWKTLREFAEHLKENVVFNDGRLLAVVKPWGIGMHSPIDLNTNKRNVDLLFSEIAGSPKYSMDDALPLLSAELGYEMLKQVKSVDRYSSGIVLYAADQESLDGARKACLRSMAFKEPYLGHLCITKGIPLIKNRMLEERVGVVLEKTDQEGFHFEPKIITEKEMTKSSYLKRNDAIPVRVSLRVLEANRSNATSLVELNTTNTRWEFVRCYIADKTSFIIGDNRFSRRIRHVLGAPIKVSPILAANDSDFEALTEGLSMALKVHRNAQIPMMIHRHQIRLAGGYGIKVAYKQVDGQEKPVRDDLIIRAPHLPQYFQWTLEQLGMLSSPSPAPESQASTPLSSQSSQEMEDPDDMQ